MKGYAIALAILLLLVAAVAWNAVYVCGVAESLLEKLDELPSVPAADPTAAAKAISREFDGEMPRLEVTVPGAALDRIRESLRLLVIYAESGDASRYAAAIVCLRERIEAMARPEKLSMDNLF